MSSDTTTVLKTRKSQKKKILATKSGSMHAVVSRESGTVARAGSGHPARPRSIPDRPGGSPSLFLQPFTRIRATTVIA